MEAEGRLRTRPAPRRSPAHQDTCPRRASRATFDCQLHREGMTMHPDQRLFLDDLYVGQRFTSGTYRIDAERIKAFAAEFDPQPFHLDEAAAQGSVFRGLAASGWHTAAVAMRLLVTGGLPLADGIIGLGGELTWPKPTRP